MIFIINFFQTLFHSKYRIVRIVRPDGTKYVRKLPVMSIPKDFVL